MKLGKKIPNKKCKWCGTWTVYECSMQHSSIFGPLSCKDCNRNDGKAGVICNNPDHTSKYKKQLWDV